MKFPNYKYEEVSTQVDFHVYQPTYLPLDIRQASAFVIIDSPIFENLTSVRVSTQRIWKPWSAMVNQRWWSLNQSAVPNGLDLFQYLKQTESAKEEPPVRLKNLADHFSWTEAYLVHDSLLTGLWLKTNDGGCFLWSAQLSKHLRGINRHRRIDAPTRLKYFSINLATYDSLETFVVHVLVFLLSGFFDQPREIW